MTDAISRFLFSHRIVNARERQQVRFSKKVVLDPEFQDLWDRISQKTRYRVTAARIKATKKVLAPAILIERARVAPTVAGVTVQETSGTYGDIDRHDQIPDVLAYLQNATDLTRHTLARILIESGRAEEIRINP